MQTEATGSEATRADLTATPGVTTTVTLEESSLEEVLQMIDQGLGGLTDRKLVSSEEVTDLLLDVRSLLVPQPVG